MRAPLLFALLLLVLTMMSYRPQASAQTEQGTVGIVPFYSSALVGEEFSVSVFLADLRRGDTVYYDDDGDTSPDREMAWTGVGGFEFTIRYDPAQLRVTAAEPGPHLEDTGRNFGCLERSDEPGSFSFGCFSMGQGVPGPAGDLTLAEVTFLPLRLGSSPLLLLEARVADPMGSGEVSLAAEGGIVRVWGGPAATATLASSVATATPPPPGAAATPLRPGDDTATTEPSIGRTTATAQPVSEDGANGEDPRVQGSGPRAENERSPNSGGGSSRGQALWLGAAVGGLAALGAAGLTAVAWQRRRRRPRP